MSGLLNKLGTAGVATAASHTTWATLDISDFSACVGLLPDRYHIFGPAWICSHSFFNQTMARIAYGAGGATMSEILSAPANARSFMGYPVFLSSKMPTATATSQKCALFGSFNRGVVMGVRGQIRVARSDDYAFLNDLITLKATSRYDYNVHDAGDSTNPGSFIALATHS